MAAMRGEGAVRLHGYVAPAGAWGAALTLVIVGLSLLVRLGTRIEAGEAVSLLPAAVEGGVRIAHRLAATGVAIAAAFALIGVASARPLATRRLVALAAILGLTLVLASIGRYTPGYRIVAVTVANVACGTLLASAFWWLREEVRFVRASGSPGSPGVAWAAFAALIGVSAMGAAASALAMHGERAFGPVHLWIATLLLLLSLVAAWRNRGARALAIAVAALACVEYLAGFVILSRAFGALPIAFPWAHAMGAAVLGLLLVSLAIRGQTPISHRDT